MEEARRTRRMPWVVLAIAALALAVTTDERFYGGVRDGREMLSAAFALAHYGEIGVSREFVNAAPGPGGEAYSRYGMGTSIAEVVPMLAARAVRAVRPDLPTSPLFVLLPLGCLAAAAALVAASAAALGASLPLAAAAGLALVFATPAWGYGGSDYSEPLQLAALSLALLGVVKLRSGASSRGWEVAAGGSAAFAVLLKSLNLLPASLLLLPALLETVPAATGRPARKKKAESSQRLRPRWALLASWGAGLGLWALLETARFGKLFGGYPGEGFDYPFVAGLLRLTLLPNKGLLFYAPILLLAPFGLLLLWRTDRLLAASLALAPLAYFAVAAGWWAWDGQAGWGPRLVVPALPFLVLLAACALPGSGRPNLALAGALAIAGAAINLPGALYPFGAAYMVAEEAIPQPIPEDRAAGTPYEIERRPDGTLTATCPHHLSLTPGWWPPYVHARLLGEGLRGGDVEGRLTAGALSDLRPPLLLRRPDGASAAWGLAVAPFRWPFVGRSWATPSLRRVDPYRDAMADQLARAVTRQDERRAAALRKGLGLPEPGRTASPGFPFGSGAGR